MNKRQKNNKVFQLKLDKDLVLLNGLPIVYIRSLEMLVGADLHLGYEGAMSKNGIFLPKANLKSILHIIGKALELTKAKRLLINGDIKNEYSRVNNEEFNELYEFIRFVSEKSLSMVLIKGNHDNFVERYKEAFKFETYKQQYKIGKYLFFHGEEVPFDIDKKVEILIMGHEHPAIKIYTEVGKAEKIKCFLSGTYNGKSFLVLPAMSYYSGGSAINIVPKQELLSPIFKQVDVDEMEAVAVGYGSTINFGKIRKLRNINIPKE